MNRRNNRPAVLRDSWRPEEQQFGFSRKLKKIASLLVLLLLLVFGVGAFFYLLSEPILHPNTYLVLVTGDRNELDQIPPVHFSKLDLERFKELEPLLAKDAAESVASPIELEPNQELNRFQQRLKSFDFRSNDVLIVYIAAHGLVIDGKACIICDGFDRSSPGVGSVSVSALIQLMAESDARTKVLLLDSGQLPYDSWLGNVAKQFVAQLQDDVRSLDTENVWVITSNHQAQFSRIDETEQTSTFAHFARLGLSGEADQNRDGLVRIQELYRYILRSVDQSTRVDGQDASQTPVLITSTLASGDPILVSVQSESNLADLVAGKTEENSTEKEGEQGSEDSTGPDAGASQVAEADPAKETSDQTAEKSGNQDGESADDAGADSLVDDDENDEPIDLEYRRSSLAWQGENSTQRQKNLESVWSESYRSSAELVSDVWKLYFELESSVQYPRRPLDFAPLQWRKLGELIAHYDYSIRRQLGESDARDRMKEIKIALEAIQKGDEIPKTGRVAAALEIQELSTPPLIGTRSIVSFSHLQQLIKLGYSEASPSLLKQIEKFEEAVNDSEPESLTKLLEENNSLLAWYEPLLAKQLLQRKELSWTEQRRALRLAMLTGYASHPIATLYRELKDRFAEADEKRRLANQLLEEQSIANWRSLSQVLLKDAEQGYVSAIRDLHSLQEGWEIQNEILFRLPYYTKLPFADSSSLVGDCYLKLDQLLDLAIDLRKRLGNYDESGIPAAVSMTVTSLVEKHQEFLNLLISEADALAPAQSLINSQAALLTPAFEESVRSQILQRLSEKVSSPETVNKPSTDSDSAQTFPVNELLAYARQASLSMKLARLTRFEDKEDEKLNQLSEQFDQLFGTGTPTNLTSSRRTELETLNNDFADYFQDIPLRVNQALLDLQNMTDMASHTSQIRKLDQVMAARMLIDSRNSRIGESVDSNAKVAIPARCFHVVNAQRNQLKSDFKYGVVSQFEPLQKRLEFQRLAANELTGQPKYPVGIAPRIEVNSAESINLTSDQFKYINVEIQYRGEKTEPTWLVAEFDPNRLIVKSEPQNPVLDRNVIFADSPLLIRPEEYRREILGLDGGERLAIPPTCRIKPGENQKFRIRVASKGSFANARLYLTAVTGTEFSRHKIDVGMPGSSDWDLTLSSPFSESKQTQSEILVSPLPNRTLDYELLLRNLSGQPKSISVDVLAPQNRVDQPPPLGELTPNQLKSYLATVGPTITVQGMSGITMPATNEAQVIPLGSTDSEGAEETGEEPPAESPAPEPTEEETGIEIRHGLLVVVGEPQSGKAQVWLVRFRPQMPRHFIRVSVRYDVLLERIIVEAERDASAAFPNEGHTIKFEFANPEVDQTESYLEGKITPENKKLRLFARVPSSTTRVEKIYIHVDDYPRAFVFNVPCGKRSQPVLESRNEMRFVLLEPEQGAGYKAPKKTIPVRFLVDAPVGAFSDSRDRVYLGIDADRDRELATEPTMSWTSDRQATIWIRGLGAKLKLENKVDDFKVELPGASYRNLKVNLLGKLQIGRKIVWSQPKEIWLDASPPSVISFVREDSGPLSEKDKVNLKIVADDKQMSGVESIKVGFYDAGSKKFIGDRPMVDAAKQPDNSWLAELPLAGVPLGFHTLAAEATDGVSLQSKKKMLGIKVVSEEEKSTQAMTFTVSGLVKYYKSPAPDTPLQLTSADGKSYTSTSNADGMFRFDNIPAGEYQLKGRSVISNTPRIGTLDFKLESEKKPGRIELELK